MTVAAALNALAWIVVAGCASGCMGVGLERSNPRLCWVSLGLCGLIFLRSVVWLWGVI